ncbi:MAG: hypothetical protein JNJ83_13325 [Verrucomicrobiaceae bacterium]|nr:hypothetical protein [Verrucomicrobiaceae bacterium]
MKIQLQSYQRRPLGGAIAIALIMTMLGGLFMAGWISIAHARSMQARGSENAARRRLVVENSRAMARQYGYDRVFQHNATQLPSVSTTHIVSANIWGTLGTQAGFTSLQSFGIYPTNSFPLAGTLDNVFPYNPAGLRSGPSFVNVQRVGRPDAYDGISDPYTAWMFVKSAAPCLGGDPFVIYKKPASESGEIVLDDNFQIDGRLVIRDPVSMFNSVQAGNGSARRIIARSKALYLQKDHALNRLTGTDMSGAELLPSNAPVVTASCGYSVTANKSKSYDGSLNVINNPDSPGNSLFHIQDREVAAGSATLLTINSGNGYGTSTSAVQVIKYSGGGTWPALNLRPPAWPSGYGEWSIAYIRLNHADLPHVRILSGIQQVVFEGQQSVADYNAAKLREPRIVITSPTTNVYVRHTFFTYENARPLIYATKGVSGQPHDMRWVGPNIPSLPLPLTLEWRMNLINEGRQTMVYILGSGAFSVAIKGGVQTNWSFERYDSGNYDRFKFTPVWESEMTYPYVRMLPRDGWMETFFTLAPP